LVRIEYLKEDGTLDIVTPDKFMQIAEFESKISAITNAMMIQITTDMSQDENMDVSINF
jgi:EAL domain-containing protein (putative c-di-GMP-specific phosphodiesterase class I)